MGICYTLVAPGPNPNPSALTMSFLRELPASWHIGIGSLFGDVLLSRGGVIQSTWHVPMSLELPIFGYPVLICNDLIKVDIIKIHDVNFALRFL